MSSEIKLWCWVQGDDLDRVFLVDVKLSDTVYELKEAIWKKKPSFERVAADTLQLWKVSELYVPECVAVQILLPASWKNPLKVSGPMMSSSKTGSR